MSPDGSKDSALAPDVVRPLLRTVFCHQIVGGGPTGSTNDDARELAEAGAPEGTIVLASSQSAGRGRFQREWDSDEGGVYVSVVLRPPLAPANLTSLPLAIGLGVARGLERVGAASRLKWPNDVVIGGRKVAGVLVESRVAGSKCSAIAGVGVNVTRPQTVDAPAGRPAYLADSCPDVTLAEAAAAVLDGIADTYVRFVAMGFASLAPSYRTRCDTLFSRVSVTDATGALIAEGEVADIDADGRLLVCSRSGISAVSAGEVTLRPPRERRF